MRSIGTMTLGKTACVLCAGLTALLLAGTALGASDIDGAEDFAQLSKNGFAFVIDGEFFEDGTFPKLQPNLDGSTRNSYAWSMAWFEGQLYVGVLRDLLCF